MLLRSNFRKIKTGSICNQHHAHAALNIVQSNINGQINVFQRTSSASALSINKRINRPCHRRSEIELLTVTKRNIPHLSGIFPHADSCREIVFHQNLIEVIVKRNEIIFPAVIFRHGLVFTIRPIYRFSNIMICFRVIIIRTIFFNQFHTAFYNLLFFRPGYGLCLFRYFNKAWNCNI